jgi:hypothetical protein
VRDALRRFPLERALQASIVATICGAMLASSGLTAWLAAGRALRLAGLASLAACALALALAWGVRRPGGVHALTLLLGGLAALSAGWSVNPRESLADGVAFAAMAGSAAAITLLASHPAEWIRAATRAVLAAIALVAIAGLVRLVLDPDETLGEATPVDPPFYAGIGGNANTAAMLLALGMPLAAAECVSAASRRARTVLAALLLVFTVSVVASGSRGALVAGFLGLAIVGVFAARSARARVAAVAVVAVAFVVATAIAAIPDPDPTAERSYTQPTGDAVTGGRYYNADAYLRLEDDVGRPPFGQAAETEQPGALSSSGRLEAWTWAVRSALERPLLGFGFGQEDKGFTDRLASFQADLPENAYIGIFLQLGLVGTACFLAVLCGVILGARRVRTTLAAGYAGAVGAGLVLAFVQSYLYAPGAVASAAFWLCAFALASVDA